MNSGMNRFPDKRDEERKFPLPKDQREFQDKQRECLGLFKLGPLETFEEFAERASKEIQANLEQFKLRHPPKPEPKPGLLARLRRWFQRQKT